ncbi:ATP-binding protein [Sinosporangium siamense]|uniref:ATP-binding protein n=1 Tax=Sinosporangium siamense TaxID=1367973 RepID=UPI0019523270
MPYTRRRRPRPARAAANAVRHTSSGKEGGAFTVDLSWESDTVRIAVIDQGGESSPVFQSLAAHFPDNDAESGRGLLLVGVLADDYGTYGDSHSRVVWAVFRQRPTAPTHIQCAS